ncbi:MAG: hypothetical protein ACD_4C00250G0004 [uncultured bacterium (gcode 4)]|uniref:Uncharacterized protein n=1 Tax=uncultured bacterium (gcode 4) TaxID=1234023 RepID=K2FXD9_9BACT|nr:MAG: hypothetical protein ACD_4C00250G0004 [uncultured bacterium (gcode 4)]
MHHIAIMNPKWKLIPKILSWEKIIESRWYQTKRTPWDRVKEWDMFYFKDSWKSVTAKAEVSKILQFENLWAKIFEEIIHKYWKDICLINMNYDSWYESKKYCILIFLKKPEKVEPFEIDKTWFWTGCAWITVSDIEKIKFN